MPDRYDQFKSKCERSRHRVTGVFAAIAAVAAADAARTGVKMLNPLGLPKLPLRMLRLGVDVAVAIGAGAVVVSREDRAALNAKIRQSIRPDKS